MIYMHSMFFDIIAINATDDEKISLDILYFLYDKKN